LTTSIWFIVGTRPEAIKQAPLINALNQNGLIKSTVVSTGQHSTVTRQFLKDFDIDIDIDISVEASNNLTDSAIEIFKSASTYLRKYNPSAVVVQGDTTSATMFAIAAFYEGISVIHLEAGLRSNNLSSPFPEEGNRKLISQVASLHLCPTTNSANNLFLENISKAKIIVIGNTVIDSLYQVIDSGKAIIPSEQKNFIGNSPLVFVTAHRRESWGEGIESISLGINSAAINNPEVKFIVCLHPNPLPRQMLEKNLKGLSNVMVVEPQPYSVICGLLNRSKIVVTDSGGIQEEAISLGKPVLITRENTERIEGIKLGLAKIVGTNSSLLNEEIKKLISETSFNLERLTGSPYGDGKAGIRGAQAIEFIQGFGSAPKPWTYIETNFISEPKGI
jgi:UDP-N-acetylglucosamine 2-epimerase (non-hydrolysing)